MASRTRTRASDGRILAMAIFAVLGLTLLFPGSDEYLSRPFVFNFLFH